MAVDLELRASPLAVARFRNATHREQGNGNSRTGLPVVAVMTVRPSRLDGELLEASRHLYYEWSMLLALEKRLQTVHRPRDIHNAYLESFTVHARALVAFAYPETTHVQKTDVIAEDYLGSVDWGGRRPKLDPILDSVHGEVGRQIVHLSYKRHDIGPEAKEWRVHDIAHAIDSALVQFTKLVRPAQTCDELRALAHMERLRSVKAGPTP